MEQLNAVTYQLDLPPNWWIYNVFHATLLSPYYEMKEHGTSYSMPPPEYIEGEPEWEVVEVLASH